MPDYYEVLGIDEEASEYEITQAYRNLAKQYHPDKFPKRKDLNMLKVKTNLSQAEENRLIQLEKKVQENEEKFKKIQEAYTVLYDIEKREKYDEERNGNQCSGTSKSSSFQEKLDKFDEMIGKIDEISRAQYERTMRDIRGSTLCIMEELNLQEKLRYILKQESLNRVLDELEDAQKKTFCSLRISLILDRLKDFAVQIEDINFSNYSKYREELIILYDKEEFLNLLIEKGVKLSNTVLHTAIEYNSMNVAYYLLNEYIDKIDINHQDENGNTVLYLALECLYLDQPKVKGIIKLLLSKGIKFDIQNKKSETPFDLLVKYVSSPINQQGRLNNIQELLSNCTVKDILKGLNGTSSLNTLAELAVYHGSEEVLKTLIEGGMNVNCQDENGDTVLHHAFKWSGSGDEWKEQNITKLLLNEGAKLDIQNKESKTPFDLLVGYVRKAHYTKKERLHYVSRILSNCTIKGTLKSLNGTSSLNELARLAVKLNNKKILNFLIKNDIKILSTILEDIVKYDFNKKIFSYFLHKNRIDYQDEGENTILHHTLKLLISNKSNYQGYVELLMSEGAKLNVKNDKGETPFDLLIEYVEKGFYGQARRLSYVWKLLNKCENKDILRELKYKDGTSALDKLNELRIKCRNTSIVVASTLVIVGVALGIAIAVHLEMLAIGVAVGACCLVAAAVIYYCNSPSNLLENSNAEAVTNDVTAERLALKWSSREVKKDFFEGHSILGFKGLNVSLANFD